jgi:signal transduction histidine kinase
VTTDNSSYAADQVQAELDKQLFHLKTLYDVSHELLGLTDVSLILRNFLLMTMGNFGAAQGFIMAENVHIGEISHFESFGFEGEERSLIQSIGREALSRKPFDRFLTREDFSEEIKELNPGLPALLAFSIDEGASGVMGLGPKIVGDDYSSDDKELLGTLVNNLAVSVKNARYSEALRKALDEIRVLNSAKDKAIAHLTHELLTPISLLKSSLMMMEKKLQRIPGFDYQGGMDRAQRSIQRLSEIQNEVEDIMKGKEHKVRRTLSKFLDLCGDEIEVLIAEQVGEGPVIKKIRERINELFTSKESEPKEIDLGALVTEKLEELRPLHSRRRLVLNTSIESTPPVWVPPDPLEKIVKGLVKNAIENTPDEGKIEVSVRSRGKAVEFRVEDWGVGIVPEQQKHIFEGFYPTQDTMLYRTGKPFEFNAGGRGADLLRMKIFSERFNFTLSMVSTRCKYLPQTKDSCPGRISNCQFCKKTEDCYDSGGTTFEVLFPLCPSADR